MTEKKYGRYRLTIAQMFSTREEAAAAGHSYFYDGNPCGKGHIAPRRVSNNFCHECQQERNNQRPQEYKESCREAVKKYRRANIEDLREKDRIKHHHNREKMTEKVRTYYQENKEKILEKKIEYRLNNKEKTRIQNRLYYLKNKWKNTEVWTQEAYVYALKFAAEKHQGQMIPGTDWPYIAHLSMVCMEVITALIHFPELDGDLAVQTALLHGILEETDTSFEELESRFGWDVADGVRSLTPDSCIIRKSERVSDCLRRIKEQPAEIRMVALADKITCLQPPPEHWGFDKRRKNLREARIICAELGDANDYLFLRLKEKILGYYVNIGESRYMIRKIISGGQPGADRAGIDAAIELGIDYGGWLRKGRKVSNGVVPETYAYFKELSQSGCHGHLEKNVLNSDGTIIFSYGGVSGSARETRKLAEQYNKPLLDINLRREKSPVQAIKNWIIKWDIRTMNVSGMTEKRAPGLYDHVRQIIITLLK